ncbi:MAG: diaminopimelate epimerase [Bacteroidia bacterium]
MQINFYKYHGAGNDFIMIDNRDKNLETSNRKLIERLCHRRFGIGADGLITIEKTDKADFEMLYYNADGGLGSMCGNGGRCTVALAKRLEIFDSKTSFVAYDGIHDATILNYDDKNFNAEVSLQMNDVNDVEVNDDFIFLNTGSPHYIKFVHTLSNVDVIADGRKVRYNDRFKSEGTNVNFIQYEGGRLVVRTYERGVEDETLSCGTGVTAAAIAYAVHFNKTGNIEIPVKTLGGDLKVKLNNTGNHFKDIYLQGSATFVYKGVIEIK